LMSVSAGVLLCSLVQGDNDYEYGSLAHWVTAAGVIVDPNATGIEDRYKAIIIAESDNNPANGSFFATDEEKAAQAANAINSYTVYPLKLMNFGDKYGWRWIIPYRVDVGGYTVIDWLAYLNDNR